MGFLVNLGRLAQDPSGGLPLWACLLILLAIVLWAGHKIRAARMENREV